MSTPYSLNDKYTEELQDLWSANSRMCDVVREMADSISVGRLAALLSASAGAIETHVQTIRELLQASGIYQSDEYMTEFANRLEISHAV